MNNLDKQYTDLLQDILENGVIKETRNGGTISVFGRQIRHNMKDGFPLLTTKKMAWKTMVTELIWFLSGSTNIKFLLDYDCHIWDGDAYKNYLKQYEKDKKHGVKYEDNPEHDRPFDQEEFINWIKNVDKFARIYGELGPIYGKQWRNWELNETMITTHRTPSELDRDKNDSELINDIISSIDKEPTGKHIDQIANLINDLKTNPDSRRLMVNAWNVGELDQMVLPPCHYGFQVYTRELSNQERIELAFKSIESTDGNSAALLWELSCQGKKESEIMEALNNSPRNIPTRAISLMWNQRSVDTFLGLPFNIASYGLLLEIIAKAVNMVPDELIGNLGDTHLYLNHIEQAKEQIGRDLTCDERIELASTDIHFDPFDFGVGIQASDESIHKVCDLYGVPRRSRQPFELPTLNINTEFWPYEGGECGMGPLDAVKVFESFKNDNFCKCLLEEDIQLSNYQAHPSIKAPLSN
jgi:thymidylate synthase